MATKSKYEAKNETNPCTNCGRPVKARRPSRSGTNWCQAVLCQRERAKFYKKRRAESAIDREKRATKEVEVLLHANVAMAVAALTTGRITCPTCDADDVVPGFPHPSLQGGRCLGVSTPDTAMAAYAPDLIAAIYPRVAQ